MKAILHIGTEKTGTSSIQKFLYKNRRVLRRRGFHLLLSAGKGNSRALPAYCKRDDRPDDYLRDAGIGTPKQRAAFRKELDASLEREIGGLPATVHTVLISSEHFHSRLRFDEEMACLQALLARFFDEIEIVCYLREQVVTCESWYSTTLKVGGTLSLAEFAQKCRPERYYYNYEAVLANWEKYFGFEALNVSLFSPDHFLNGDLLDDFTAKLDKDLVGVLNKRVALENESLSPPGQVLARALNLTFPPGSGSASIEKLKTKCKRYIYRRFRGSGQQLPEHIRQSVYASFAEVNERVRQKFFPEESILFSPPKVKAHTDELLGPAFSDVLVKIWDALRRQRGEHMHGRRYVDFFRAISICVADMEDIEHFSGPKKHGRQIMLDTQDAHLLHVSSQVLESRSTYLAAKVLALAGEINPDLPELDNRLAEYGKMGKAILWPYFLFSYREGTMPEDPEQTAVFQVKFTQWLSRLRSPLGHPIGAVRPGTAFNQTEFGGGVKPDMDSYSVVQARSLEEAIELAKSCPYIDIGGDVRVFPLKPLGAHPDQ